MKIIPQMVRDPSATRLVVFAGVLNIILVALATPTAFAEGAIDPNWKILPRYQSELKIWPGLGSSAPDTTYTDEAVPITVYYDSVTGNDSNPGTFALPKRNPFQADVVTTFNTAKKIGIFAGSKYYFTFATGGSGLANITGANVKFVGVNRTTGQEIKPPRDQFTRAVANGGSAAGWVTAAERDANYWFIYGDNNSVANTGTKGAAFFTNAAGTVIRNCWEEGFALGLVRTPGNTSGGYSAVIEDCYVDNNWRPGTPPAAGTGYFVRDEGDGKVGVRVVGTYVGGNIGEDLFWQQSGNGPKNFYISDCLLRTWAVANTKSANHCDWMQTGGYPGQFTIRRTIGEHRLPETLLENLAPIGGGFLINAGTAGSGTGEAGTITDFILVSNVNGTNDASVVTLGTMSRTRFGIGIYRSPVFTDGNGSNNKVVVCLNDNAPRTYADSDCRAWYQNRHFSNDDWANGPAKTNVNASGGHWTVNFNPVANGAFETPTQTNFQPRPTGGIWTFTGNSGIQLAGGAWGATVPFPDGNQTAFLQGNNGIATSMSQTITVNPGTYVVTFQAARRNTQIQPIQLSVDGTNVGTPIVPASKAWATYTSAPFTIGTTGDHVIQFATTENSTGDKSTFIDQVEVKAGGGPSAAAPSLKSTASRLIHGSQGTYEVSLTSPDSIEPRRLSSGNFSIVFSFDKPVASATASVVGTGSVQGAPVASGNTLTVNLTGVANAQTLQIHLAAIAPVGGGSSGSASVSFKLLKADLNFSNSVNSTDVALAKSKLGSVINATTAPFDINASGSINSTDVAITKSVLGTTAP